MHIGILQTGRSSDELDARHGSFASMFEAWLGRYRPGLAFTTWNVYLGEFPERVDACNAWLITGSVQGVYERDDWMLQLEAFVREAAGTRVPQIGICFGHQLIASAFGGEVSKATRGWGLGTHVVEVHERAEWMVPEAGAIALHAAHQDQVVAVPDGARVIAGNDFCPASALVYPKRRALSFQGHPEHRLDFARDIIEMRRARGVDAEVADRARASLETPTDEAVVAEWVLRFIEDGAGPR